MLHVVAAIQHIAAETPMSQLIHAYISIPCKAMLSLVSR